MTRQETINNLKAYLNGDTAIDNIIPLRSVLESAIKYLEPSLPSNLDEAAEEYANTHYGEFIEVEYEFGSPIETIVDDKPFVRDAFKAGTEWMAEQGASFNTEVGWIDGPTILDWPDDILDKFEMGDKVVVQIRKL